MTETTARIRWHEEYPGTFYGRVGTLESWGFELWQSPGDCGDYVLGDWVLTAPFIFADRCLMNGRYTLSDRDPEKLKADAERLLGEFTASLGATFPEPASFTATRDRLATALTRLDVRVLASGPCAGMVDAWSMADSIIEALRETETSAPVAGEKE